MRIADAQLDMRRTYRGGLPGQLVSAALWAASAACDTWGDHRLAVLVLVIGGFFIFPLTLLALRLRRARPAAEATPNPLNALAMQVAFTLPLGLPVVLTLAYFSPNRFYPATMLLLGAHYLPFMFLYGMWQWAILAGVLIGGGYVLGWVAPMGFAAGGWLAAAALLAFALAGWRLVIAEERRAAA